MERVMLRNGDMTVALLDHGAITQGWWLGDTPLILGYDDQADYLNDRYFMGIIAGRVANRIGGASFDLDGRRVSLPANDGPNHLHGGPDGLGTRSWSFQAATRDSARLTLHSPDGDGGYPGDVEFQVSVRLTERTLEYEFHAYPNRPTPISLAQHNYYCLASHPDTNDHRLQVMAQDVLDLDAGQVPTGRTRPVAGRALDYRQPARLSQTPEGIDNFFIFDAGRNPAVPVATLSAPNGLTLKVHSDQPGAQIYSGDGLGGRFSPRAGICIEPSGYPDAVNRPDFPSVIATREDPYHQYLRLEIEGAPT